MTKEEALKFISDVFNDNKQRKNALELVNFITEKFTDSQFRSTSTAGGDLRISGGVKNKIFFMINGSYITMYLGDYTNPGIKRVDGNPDHKLYHKNWLDKMDVGETIPAQFETFLEVSYKRKCLGESLIPRDVSEKKEDEDIKKNLTA